MWRPEAGGAPEARMARRFIARWHLFGRGRQAYLGVTEMGLARPRQMEGKC
jgi:hypothetical protein